MTHKKRKKKNYSETNGSFQLYYDRVVDFHGYYPDKAVLELEEIVFSSPPNSAILVIHGVGTGILKQALRNFIISTEYVSSYEFGEEANLPGGAGVILVYT